MKLSKIALATAALAAMASGTAFAGQIDASSATLAREVIWDNALQTVRAPSKSYAFIGAIDARTNEQRLQLQWTLSGGLTWAGGDLPTLSGTALTPLVTATQTLLRFNGLNNASAAANFGSGAVTGFQTPATDVSINTFTANAGTTLVFNITIASGALNRFSDVVFQINSLDFTGVPATAANVGVKNALTASGPMACRGPDTSTQVNFKHFTNHNGTILVQTGDITTNPDSEHLRIGSTNDGRFLNFTENLDFLFTPGVQSQTDATTLRTTLIRTAADILNYAPAAATLVTTAPRLHRIANNIDLRKVAAGLDLDYTAQYGLTGTFAAADFNIVPLTTPALNVNGIVNANAGGLITINVTTPTGIAGWAPNSTIAVLDQADALIPGAVVVAPTAGNLGVASVTFTTAAAAAAFSAGTGGRLYYVLAGGATDFIPQNSVFATTATLVKTKAGPTQERDNVCKRDLPGIGGGIKIDIRNYASRAKFPTGNFASYVRLINNSESQAADVFAQMIYADGTYGPYGQLPSLAPRAVANYSNAQLEALLITTPAVINPFGAGTFYTQTAGAAVVGTGAAGIGDRIRFVSNTGTTLRVQSFMLLPTGNLLDTTNAQGVDFENESNNRTPITAKDAQPVSQDAINGLAR